MEKKWYKKPFFFKNKKGGKVHLVRLNNNNKNNNCSLSPRYSELQPLQEQQKDLQTDIVGHQADLRFMSMAAQKYMEEAKVSRS